MTIFQANRGLVEGDLEWLRATIDARRMDIRIVNSGIAMMQNDRINRILQALASISSPEASTPSAEWRERVARIIDPKLELGGVTAREALAKADEIAAVSGGVQGWRPMSTAPKDGTQVWAYCVHRNHKYAPDHDKARWTEVVLAQWIDHNGGGWTWNGIAGEFRAWQPANKPEAPSNPGEQHG